MVGERGGPAVRWCGQAARASSTLGREAHAARSREERQPAPSSEMAMADGDAEDMTHGACSHGCALFSLGHARTLRLGLRWSPAAAGVRRERTLRASFNLSVVC